MQRGGRGTGATYQHISLDVAEGKFCALPEGLVLTVDPVVLSNVLLETPHRKRSFLFTEPGGGAGEIGQDPKGDERDRDSDNTLDKEEPL